MKFEVKKTFIFTVDSVKLAHLLEIYPKIKMPYWYKTDGSIEFTMNEEDTENLMGAIIIKYEEQDYDFLEGLDLEAMNLALELEDKLSIDDIFPANAICVDLT